MRDQVIITLGRQSGSGGIDIGRLVVEKLGIGFYGKNILARMEEEGKINAKIMDKFDEKPSSMFFTRHMRGLSSSMEENLAMMEFCFIRDRADEGESFLVVGRCANEVLKENDNVISIFIHANQDSRIKRIMERDGVDEKHAIQEMKRTDSDRKNFHNSYSSYEWGDANGYDLCIDSDALGIEATADLIVDFVNKFKNQ